MILALMMLVVVSLIVLSIASLTLSSIRNSSNFSAAQSETTAANNVTDVALQYSASTFLQATTGLVPGPCGPTNTNPTLTSMTAWCRTQWSPHSAQTRTVTIDTCPSSVTSGIACAQSPFLQAVVVFDDYATSSSSSSSSTYDSCVPVTATTTATSCGQGVTLESWAFGDSPPAVASWSTTSSSSCTTTPVSITVSGSYSDISQLSVDYVPFSAVSSTTGLPLSTSAPALITGQVISATPSLNPSQTTIVACGPASGNTDYVVVTTPFGSGSSFGLGTNPTLNF